jgi:hypothetical protein
MLQDSESKNGLSSILHVLNSCCNQFEKEAISSMDRRIRKTEAVNKVLDHRLEKEIERMLKKEGLPYIKPVKKVEDV